MHYIQSELIERLSSDPELLAFFDGAAVDGIWCLDMENMEEEWYSPKFKAVLGYQDEEVPHKAFWWQEHIHPDDLPAVYELLERHLADPSIPFDQIVRYRHKNGSLVTVRCRGIVLRDETGTPKRMMGTHTDVSALKASEEALRKANTTLRAFAATVSHDLKAPMRQMGVLSKLARQRIQSADYEGAMSLLLEVEAASARSMGTVDGLLRLSEVQRYRPPADAEADLFACAQAAASSHGAEGTDIHIDPMPLITGDEALLTTLLSNLIANAIKYNDKPRARIHVRSFIESGHLVVQVDDNGPGISEAEQERIFQPLVRGASTGGVDGHGIGLALCRAVAEAHGGEITTCLSQLGGACIELRLPDSLVIHPERKAHRRNQHD